METVIQLRRTVINSAAAYVVALKSVERLNNETKMGKFHNEIVCLPFVLKCINTVT